MNTDPTTASMPTGPAQRQATLRQTINEAVGVTFFEPMLKAAHNSKLKGKYGHGGQGEKVFQGQLDAQLAASMGRGVKTDLGEALYRKLTRQVH